MKWLELSTSSSVRQLQHLVIYPRNRMDILMLMTTDRRSVARRCIPDQRYSLVHSRQGSEAVFVRGAIGRIFSIVIQQSQLTVTVQLKIRVVMSKTKNTKKCFRHGPYFKHDCFKCNVSRLHNVQFKQIYIWTYRLHFMIVSASWSYTKCTMQSVHVYRMLRALWLANGVFRAHRFGPYQHGILDFVSAFLIVPTVECTWTFTENSVCAANWT